MLSSRYRIKEDNKFLDLKIFFYTHLMGSHGICCAHEFVCTSCLWDNYNF